MSEVEFKTTADADEFAEAIWEAIGDGVDAKVSDDSWDAVSSQVTDTIMDEAWDAVEDNVHEAARQAADEHSSNSDGVEEGVADLLRAYNERGVGTHCAIGESATELVTKVIQWHLDTSADEGGLLSSQVVAIPDEVALVVLEATAAGLAERLNELTSVVSRLEATTAGFRAKHDTPEGVLAYAEATLKHILIAVQGARGADHVGEPF